MEEKERGRAARCICAVLKLDGWAVGWADSFDEVALANAAAQNRENPRGEDAPLKI